MKTIFINTENSKTNEPHIFKLNLTDKLNLKNPNKNMALTNLSIYYSWKNIKSKCNNNKFKISALTWNNTFGLRDGSYSIADTQDYFEFIIRKHETLTENPPIQIYPNKIIRKYKKDADADKNSENVPKLESAEIALVYCNLVKNAYQHTSKGLFSFVLNKKIGQLINISPHSLIMMNTINTEFSFVEVRFTDQTSKALAIEDNVNLTLIIG